jgi:ABC-type dipeptide/oligopeptide/nickel transport system permease component
MATDEPRAFTIIIVGVSPATLILDLAYPLRDPRIRTSQA